MYGIIHDTFSALVFWFVHANTTCHSETTQENKLATGVTSIAGPARFECQSNFDLGQIWVTEM
jgi:hypothetical protein